MIRKTQTIKAFTLTEMTVVIVISAIVVGLAFTILEVVQKNMRSIEANYTYQSEMQSLETALTIDFNKYPTAVWDSKEHTVTLSSPIGKKTYLFAKDSITNDIASFLITTKSSNCYFQGKEVTTGRIDAIKLTFEQAADLHRIFVFRHNDPSIQY